MKTSPAFCLALSVLLGAFAPAGFAQSPGSMLRVGCEGADAGAEVSINGKFKGECPLDIQVEEGSLQLRLVKAVDATHERIFEQTVRIGDGVVKRVDARLGQAQLTQAGRELVAQAQAAAKLREEARLRDLALAAQQKAAAIAFSLAELKAQGFVPGDGKSFRDCPDCPEMVWVPPGRPPQRPDDNNIVGWLNRVRIDYPFAVGKFEVTFAEWDQCVAEGGCSKGPTGKGPAEGVTPGFIVDTPWGRGRQPVINVNMVDVKEYLAWLSKRTGQTYRLLSLAEFTYAARGGRSSKLPWGDEVGRNNANCANCGSSADGKQAMVVGSFKANDWGLHDMVGNVAEMVADCAVDARALGDAPTDGSPFTQKCLTPPAEYQNILGNQRYTMGGHWLGAINPGINIDPSWDRAASFLIGLRVARPLTPRASDASAASNASPAAN
ncbi:SUMF1/EgtB/PvdO family nonheme iron enzyme [Paucibacter sp. B2R-40]|uniref:SUMF1/EgtB/PvdO family nonheme iron enzyme n=1 Tax=Paucibacter sp. B2R-40 TaxID=2893554 RepID=UPI0021E4AF65|nr:SUMF1/EgtB/PvdO family nonheme iron enzyme [Paucibacter sp. B2R-40]MCV2353303.1 SUMF1/EgtB/PvdO family nonheme iron enzyme [Paucibacter sp. B2R-40]